MKTIEEAAAYMSLLLDEWTVDIPFINPAPDDLIARTKTFIEELARLGCTVRGYVERHRLRTMISYWASMVRIATGELYHGPRLLTPDDLKIEAAELRTARLLKRWNVLDDDTGIPGFLVFVTIDHIYELARLGQFVPLWRPKDRNQLEHKVSFWSATIRLRTDRKAFLDPPLAEHDPYCLV